MNQRYRATVRQLVVALAGGVALLALASPAAAQTHSVTGTISGADTGLGLAGANVLVKGTTTGATASPSGDYALTGLSPQDTLVFSYIGYLSREVPVEGRTEIDVRLDPDVSEIGDVVVVGYGNQERRDITGSVVSLEAREIQELPVNNVAEALQGRAPGVVALNQGGRPGESVQIVIRGERSLNADNGPLFVIDGIPAGGLNDINPQDIVSMEVLKDASATAIYGSRGANGVVLVTTNRGQSGRPQIQYAGRGGVSTALGRPDYMTAAQYVELNRQGSRTYDPATNTYSAPQPDDAVFNAAELDAIARGIDTDYYDMVMGTGSRQEHTLSVSGGSDALTYYVSGNYLGEEGIVRSQDFERGSFRLNLNVDATDWLRVGTTTQVTRQNQDWASNPLGGAAVVNPLSEPYDASGDLVPNPGADPLLWNPLFDYEEDTFIDTREQTRVFGNLFAEVDLPVDGLQYRLNFGPDMADWRRGVFLGSMSTARQGGDPAGEVHRQQWSGYTLDNILTYAREFGADHDLDLTGLFSIEQDRYERLDLVATGIPVEDALFYDLGSAETVTAYDTYLEERGLVSYMGRANYQFKDRYLLTLTGRVDGSSVLAEGNKWDFFPSVGLGWVVSEEPFLRNSAVVSSLKLRASYGAAGNQAIAPYLTRGGLSRVSYLFGDTPAFGYATAAAANPSLGWERSVSVDVGLEFGLFGNRVSGTFDLYQTTTEDLLQQRSLPPTSGFGSIWTNIGSTRNRGFELGLNTLNVSTPDFSWSTDFNVFANRSEITDVFGDGETSNTGNRWFIGEPRRVHYDYEMIGVWQLDEAAEAASYGAQPGEIKLRDVNGDGQLNEDDRVIIGSVLPTLSGGLTNRFRFKTVDFSFFLFGAFGHTVNNLFLVDNNALFGRYNNVDVNYWTPENPSNEFPRADISAQFPRYRETMGYQSGDFLKVRNVQLGYTLPGRLSSDLGVRYMRLSLSANSPLVYSRVQSGLDPEAFDGNISAGDVPPTRLYTLGLNLTF